MKMKKINIIAILLFVAVCSTAILSKSAQAVTYKTNQSCTAYVSTGNEMANGKWPRISDVAVHPKTRNGTTPIIPFGTSLYIDSINAQGKTPQIAWVSPRGVLIYVLSVGDLGDRTYDRGLTTYWVDLFFEGFTTEAKNWGKGSISYHYY